MSVRAARRAAARQAILTAAHDQVAEDGYASAGVTAVAHRACVATGSIYRHFPSKAELFAEVFRQASQREVDAMAAAAAHSTAPAPERVAAGVEIFARRALRGRRMAYALLAEPVDPAVEAERLIFRRAFHEILAGVIADGVESGELPGQDVAVSAAALVGAIGEALVGPLSPTGTPAFDGDALVRGLVAFCLRSITDQEILTDVDRRAA